MINFSGLKQSAIAPIASSVRTKWSAENPEQVPSQPASRKLCCRIWYFRKSGKKLFFFRLTRFSGHSRRKWTWIRILQVKIINLELFLSFILDVFNLFSVAVIEWKSQSLSALNFWESRNFPVWWETIRWFLDLRNLNLVFIFTSRHGKLR